MATIIKLNCVNQELTFAENPLIASGGYNEDKLQITFCELWRGYAKVCVFYQNPNKHYFAMMEEDDTCVIPYEALQSDGVLYLGVFGCNAEGKTRTSQIVKYMVEKGAININLEPQEPTPDIYEQLLIKYQEMLETSKKTYQDEQTFESNITQRQNTFEDNITAQQNDFESSINQEWNTYKIEIPTIAENKATEVVNSLLGNYYKKTETYSSTEIDNKLSSKSNSNHNHDTRYYQKSETYSQSEVNTKLSEKADISSLGTQVTYTLEDTTLNITTK